MYPLTDLRVYHYHQEQLLEEAKNARLVRALKPATREEHLRPRVGHRSRRIWEALFT